MFDLFQAASDDQLALMGCAGAILVSGFLMYVSYFLGPMAKQERIHQMERLVRQRQQLLEQHAAEIAREKAA